MRAMYEWVLAWAETKQAIVALLILALAESSFFPIPPDVLLIAMAVATPRSALRYAAIATLGSVVGGMVGYLIGAQLYEAVGEHIIRFYHLESQWETVKLGYQGNAFLLVTAAGFTPIPYKVFTIAGGACGIYFPTLVFASLLSRGTRFFLVAGLIRLCGPGVKGFIDRYFNLLSVAFFVLLVLGFYVARVVLK
ncbi:DedA family protein [Candidatus Fermentibacteria bacterium]|nr:DedA family protein [Candidatus Fermentibacteria bacterium]